MVPQHEEPASQFARAYAAALISGDEVAVEMH
jgi:hypothetical protein